MYSFISSFKRLGQVFRFERSVRVLLAALFLILLTGFILSGTRESDQESDPVKERFWALKTRFLKPEYNVVLYGDSRLYRGISPEAMRSALPDLKIINFGYSNGGHDRLMLNSAISLLDPEAKLRIIVLGVTPLSLTQVAAQNEHYLSIMRKPFSEAFESVYFLHLKSFILPIFPIELKDIFSLSRAKRKEKHTIYHDDGWAESWDDVPNPEAQLSQYKDRFTSNQVSSELFQDLFQVISECKSKGIKIIGFRPPTTRAMVTLEDSMSGFHEDEFIIEFRKSGGIWLSFNIDDYDSYDGSHLDSDSALKLSRVLAEKIRDIISGE